MTTIQVKGLSQLNAFLQRLPAKLEAGVLRGGLRAGAKVVEEQVQSNLRSNGSVDSGRLLASVRVSTKFRRGRVSASVFAGGRSGAKKAMSRGGRVVVGYAQAFYAHWVEFGTAPHKIRPKKPGGFLAIGRGVFVRGVQHPGSRARPFMRPALDARARDALVATANYMKARLATKHGLDTADVDIDAS